MTLAPPEPPGALTAGTRPQAGAPRLARLWRRLARGAFQTVLASLPKAALARLAGAPPQPDGLPDWAPPDPRARLHARLVTRFGAAAAGAPLDPVQARAPRLVSLQLLEGRPAPMAEIRALTLPGPAGPLAARLYTPPGCPDPAPALIFLHFGGCVLGDLDTCHTACTILARHGRIRVLSLAYRLAPEHRFPAALEDCLAALRWLRQHAAEMGIDPARIGIGGDSAGGYLAAALALELIAEGATPPKMQLLIYPVLEMDRAALPPAEGSYPLTRADMDWFSQLYLRSPADAADPLCSVGRAVDLRALPPTLLIQARHDLLFAEGLTFAARLASAGVPLVHRIHRSLPHAFSAMTGALPAARAAMIETAELTGAALRADTP